MQVALVLRQQFQAQVETTLYFLVLLLLVAAEQVETLVQVQVLMVAQVEAVQAQEQQLPAALHLQ